MTTTTHDDLGLAAETPHRWFVTALRDGVERPHTAEASATVPAIAIADLTWQGGRVPGAGWTVTFSGDPQRQASVELAVTSWHDDDGGQLPEPRSTTVPVDVAEDEPGRYRAGFVLPAGTATVEGITATLADGAGAAASSSATRLPVAIRPRLRVDVAALADAFPGARLTVTHRQQPGAQRSLDGGAVVDVDDLGAASGYDVRLLSARGSELGAAGDVELRAGLVTAVALEARVPATLSARAVDADGRPLADVDVTVEVGRRTSRGSTAADGRFAVPGELFGGQEARLTLRVRDDRPYATTQRSVTLHGGDNAVDVALEPLAAATVTGTVSRRNGQPAGGARVVLSQRADGRVWNATATADDDGTFRVTGLRGPGTLTASWGSAPSFSTAVEAPAQDVTLPQIVPFNATRVDLEVLARSGDGPWEQLELDHVLAFNLRLAVTSPLGEQPISGSSVVVTSHAGATVDVCGGGRSSGLARSCTSVEIGEQESVTAQLRLQSAGTVRGRLVTTDGRPVSSGTYRLGAAWDSVDPSTGRFVAQVPEAGSHHLTLTGTGGTASRDFTLEAGQDLDLGDIVLGGNPWLAASSVTAVQPQVPPGGRAELRVSARPGGAGTVTDMRLALPLPHGTEFVPGSLTVDGQPATPTQVTGDEVLVDLGDRSYPAGSPQPGDAAVVRYRVDTGDLAAGTTLRFPAVLTATRLGQRTSHHLGAAVVTVSGVTLTAPESSSSRDLVVSGRAPAGATVRVSDGPMFLGEAVASPGGLWRLAVTLPDRGSIADHDLWAEADHDGVALQSSVHTVRVDRRLPELTEVELRQGTRVARFDPRQGTAMFPFVYQGSPLQVALRFEGAGEVADAVAQVGGTQAAAAPSGDRHVATLDPGHHGLGPVRARVAARPAPYGFDEPLPTLAQVRQRVPAAFGDVAEPRVTMLPSDGDVERLAVSAALPGLGAGGRMEATTTVRWGATYTPTAEDLAAAAATGVPIYGLQTSGSVSATRAELRLTAWVPQDRLPRSGSVAQPAGAAQAGFVQVVLEKVFTGADLLNSIQGNEGGNDRLRRLERLKAWVDANCTGSAPESFHRFANELGDRIIRDELHKYGNSLFGGVIGAVDAPAGVALWFSTFPMGLAHGLQQRRGHRPPRGPRPQRRGVRARRRRGRPRRARRAAAGPRRPVAARRRQRPAGDPHVDPRPQRLRLRGGRVQPPGGGHGDADAGAGVGRSLDRVGRRVVRADQPARDRRRRPLRLGRARGLVAGAVRQGRLRARPQRRAGGPAAALRRERGAGVAGRARRRGGDRHRRQRRRRDRDLRQAHAAVGARPRADPRRDPRRDPAAGAPGGGGAGGVAGG